MLILQNISYIHPNRELLFDGLDFTLNPSEKTALIGSNGVGKSTLFKMIIGTLAPSGGQLRAETTPYYIPQLFGQYNDLTIAEALRIDSKLNALKEILDGTVTEENLDALNDDWSIEERCEEAMAHWQLSELQLTQKMGALSGGQKTKVFLAGISIHQPAFILLDEPSNHLDTAGRRLLYDFIKNTSATLLVISHDRKLLNLLDTVCELHKHGITVYGGNYDFYAQQKKAEKAALQQDIKSQEKTLRKAKEKERETVERKQRLDARGKRKQEKAGVAKILMNTLRNKAENSTAKLKNVHSEKIGGISQELQALRATLPDIDKMKFGFDPSALHKGKILFKATGINFRYEKSLLSVRDGANREALEAGTYISGQTQPFLWNENLDFQITSGERIALKGTNGSGKTTLVKIILGELEPPAGVEPQIETGLQTGSELRASLKPPAGTEPPLGTVYRAINRAIYIDQDYTLIQNDRTVYEQVQSFNTSALSEGELKTRLNRFLFTKEDWDKSCAVLSGGERMRLMLCCLTVGRQAPDIIILDEPTNNLDIQNIEILTAAINDYQGALIVISHDEVFLEEVGIERVATLSPENGISG